MKILVIGGTQFIGRHVVEKLLKHGYDVTLLNRGQTAPGLFPDLQSIMADRQSPDLKNVKGLQQSWDAVIDLSAYYPKDVASLLDILDGFTSKYIFCSTISVYETLALDGASPMLTEKSKLLSCTPEEAVDTSMMTYGKRKAECERLIEKNQSKIPFAIIRPSVVFGAYDHTDRFAYWIARVSRTKKFILPDDGLTTTHRTYAPDLAEAFVSCLTAEAALGNTYIIAETEPLNFRETVTLIGKHLNINALDNAVSVSTEWLLKQDVKPWANIPLWIPRTNMLFDTFASRRDLGFVSTTPDEALAQATDAFLKENRSLKTGMSFEFEDNLLAQWNNQND